MSPCTPVSVPAKITWNEEFHFKIFRKIIRSPFKMHLGIFLVPRDIFPRNFLTQIMISSKAYIIGFHCIEYLPMHSIPSLYPASLHPLNDIAAPPSNPYQPIRFICSFVLFACFSLFCSSKDVRWAALQVFTWSIWLLAGLGFTKWYPPSALLICLPCTPRCS